MKGLIKFEKKGKLSHRFIRPFGILERIVTTAYRLILPPKLANVHDVFHISLLRKYHLDPLYVIQHEDIPIKKNMSYQEIPLELLDKQERVLRNKTISMVKVL